MRQDLVEVVADLHRPALEVGRHQGRRADQGDLGAEGRERLHVGAGHPGVLDVADDRRPASRRRSRPGGAGG